MLQYDNINRRLPLVHVPRRQDSSNRRYSGLKRGVVRAAENMEPH